MMLRPRASRWRSLSATISSIASFRASYSSWRIWTSRSAARRLTSASVIGSPFTEARTGEPARLAGGCAAAEGAAVCGLHAAVAAAMATAANRR